MDIKTSTTVPIKLDQAQQPKKIQQTPKLPDELERQKLKLRKSTDEFESFFVSAMLKSMRQTIPQSEDSPMGGGLGKDIFESMFDTEIAKTIAEHEKDGVGDKLYSTLEKRLVAQYERQKATGEKQGLEMIQPETPHAQPPAPETTDKVVSQPIDLKED